MRFGPAWLVLAWAASCTFSPDFTTSAYRCAEPPYACPAGFECRAGLCERTGADAHPDGPTPDAPWADASPDAPAPDAPVGLVYRAPRASGSVTIDGVLDEYSDAPTVTFSDQTSRGGGMDNTATVRVLWDSGNVYIGYQVQDTQLRAIATAPGVEPWAYEDDNLEIYVDGLNDHLPFPDGDDRHFFVNLQNLADDSGGGVAAALQSAVTLNGTINDDSDTDTGYVIEVALPWSVLAVTPSPGRTIGLDLCAADLDDAGTYEHYDWAGLESFAAPDRWGDLVLVN